MLWWLLPLTSFCMAQLRIGLHYGSAHIQQSFQLNEHARCHAFTVGSDAREKQKPWYRLWIIWVNRDLFDLAIFGDSFQFFSGMASRSFQKRWRYNQKEIDKKKKSSHSDSNRESHNYYLPTLDANNTNTASQKKKKKRASISSSHRQAKQAASTRIRGAILSALIAWIHWCDWPDDIDQIILLFLIQSSAQHISISNWRSSTTPTMTDVQRTPFVRDLVSSGMPLYFPLS